MFYLYVQTNTYTPIVFIMSIFLTLVPVYAQSPYFLVPFSHNCTICLGLHVDPQILICGHVFCKSCIDYCQKSYKRCVCCGMYIAKRYDVKFVFYKEIVRYDTIIMRRGDASKFEVGDVNTREENPFCIAYFDLLNKNIDAIAETCKNPRCITSQARSADKCLSNERDQIKNISKNVKNLDISENEVNEEHYNKYHEIDKTTGKNKAEARKIVFEGLNIQDFTRLMRNNVVGINVTKSGELNKGKIANLLNQRPNANKEQNTITNKGYTWKDLSDKIAKLAAENEKQTAIEPKVKVLEEKIAIKLDQNKCKAKLKAFVERLSCFIEVSAFAGFFDIVNYEFLAVADQILQNYKKLDIKNDDEQYSDTVTDKIRYQNLKKRKNLENLKNVFYQSADGQQYYMKQKDTEKLISKYIDYDRLPEFVICKVINIYKITYQKEKYLSHIPNGKTVHFMSLCFDL